MLYFQRNGATFIIPADAPPDYPINPPAAAPAREAAQAANLTERRAWNTYLIVATITRNQFAAAINDVYYAALNDPTEGLKAISSATSSRMFKPPTPQSSSPKSMTI